MPHLGGLPICKSCGASHRPNVSCPAKGQSVDEFNRTYGVGFVKQSAGPGSPQTRKVEMHSDAMGFCMTHLCWHQSGQSCTK
jgi:hypothetical protein